MPGWVSLTKNYVPWGQNVPARRQPYPPTPAYGQENSNILILPVPSSAVRADCPCSWRALFCQCLAHQSLEATHHWARQWLAQAGSVQNISYMDYLSQGNLWGQ
ncbi:hypothetical protein PISMIDRAFT_466746 [Pisolithus microcarpus 441]|uniref:Uncharacterized protein n=1 Tax=Pisolithus microcarpus 441 TaxID=765257 RepID=A0A0C9YEJ1_9AGAM|nr:hypothetical protein PISMIDRAFT_466746 [Pisolithus microcarpus 441]